MTKITNERLDELIALYGLAHGSLSPSDADAHIALKELKQFRKEQERETTMTTCLCGCGVGDRPKCAEEETEETFEKDKEKILKKFSATPPDIQSYIGCPVCMKFARMPYRRHTGPCLNCSGAGRVKNTSLPNLKPEPSAEWIEMAAEEISENQSDLLEYGCRQENKQRIDIIAKHHAKSAEHELLVRCCAFAASLRRAFTPSVAVMLDEDMAKFGLMGERGVEGYFDKIHPDILKYAKEWKGE